MRNGRESASTGVDKTRPAAIFRH